MSTKKFTDSELKSAVKNSISIAEVIRSLNLRVGGANYNTIKKEIERLNIDISHLKGKKHGKTWMIAVKAATRSFEDVLIDDSDYTNTSNLKKRLLNKHLLENKCYICDLKPEWHNEPLVMVLDHINGKNNDNRLENLRLLCPNCNSQQPTFTSRNLSNPNRNQGLVNYISRGRRISFKSLNKKKCLVCGKSLNRGKIYCSLDCAHTAQKKVERPSKKVLLEELKNSNYSALGRKYDVSDNAIRKWLKNG